MDYKFLDKVCAQIISETRVNNDVIYTPFLTPISSLFFPVSLSPLLSFFFSHCKEVYSLNKEETDYVWEKYKKGIIALMDKKELTHQEKG
tara:strand:- start:205 stop:474 length:270 start_codon:yes stop_codon:yes gene_type:complete